MSLTMNEHSPFYPKAATVHKIFRGGYEFSNVTECVYAKKKVSSKICADDTGHGIILRWTLRIICKHQKHRKVK